MAELFVYLSLYRVVDLLKYGMPLPRNEVANATNTGDGKMHWETLPKWFWVIYYLFLVITIGTAIFSVMRKKMISLSIVAIIFAATVPIVSLISSIGRVEGINEYEHFIRQLQQGAIWSIYAIIGYLFLVGWWVLFLLKSKTRNQDTV